MFENREEDLKRIIFLLNFLIDEHGFSTPVTREEWYGKFLYYYKKNVGICVEYDFRDKFFGLKIANLMSLGNWHELENSYLTTNPDGDLIAGYPTTIVTKGLGLRDLGLAHQTGDDEIARQINRDMYLINKYMPSILEGSVDVFFSIKHARNK